MGRGFYEEENQPGKDAVAVITYSLWQRRFGGDPNIVNKTVTLNSITRTVVGVMPQQFNFPKGAEVYAPLALTPQLMSSRENHSYYVIGRLKSGVTQQAAQSDIDTIAGRLGKQYPQTNSSLGANVIPVLKGHRSILRRCPLGNDGGCRFRSADCLRKRSELDACPCDWATKGDRVASCFGRQPLAHRPAVAYGKPNGGVNRWSTRSPSRILGN